MAGERMQASFAMGEVAPEFHGRVDLELFRQALKTCKNFIVGRLGSLANRTGMRRVFGEFIQGSTRVVPFKFSNEEQYLIVFGVSGKAIQWAGDVEASYLGGAPGYVIRGGVQVASFVHPYSIDDLRELKFTQVRDIMTIVHKNHRPRELRRYPSEEWKLISFPTDRTVYPPTAVQGTGTPSATAGDRDWEWVVTSVNVKGQESLQSAIVEVTCTLGDAQAPVNISLTPPTIGETPVSYNVYRGRNGYFGFVGSTDVAGADAFEDRGVAPSYGDGPPKAADPFTTTGVQVLTDMEEPFSGGEVELPVGATVPYDNVHTITYSLDVDEGDTATVLIEYDVASAGTWPDVATKVHGETGSWLVSEGATPEEGLVYTYIRSTKTFEVKYSGPGLLAGDKFRLTVSSGTGVLIPLTVTWTEDAASTETVYHYPSAVCLFEQRIVFGGFSDEPSRIVTSRTGDFHNFDTSDFIQDDESVELFLASGMMDSINDLSPFRSIIALTGSSEWSVRGGADGPLTPASFDSKPHTYNGSSGKIEGLRLDGELFFVTSNGKTIKSMVFSQERDALQATQVNIQASHLFTSTVKRWSYEPNDEAAIVWVVLTDGTLLSLTYDSNAGLAAWSKHETNGLVEDVVSVVEGGAYSTYVTVARPRHYTAAGSSTPVAAAGYTLDNPQPIVQLERIEKRYDTDSRFGNYLDSSAVYSGINASGTLTMTPSATGDTITASASFFTADMVGDRMFLRDPVPSEFLSVSDPLQSSTARDDPYVFEITAFTSATEVECTPISLTDDSHGVATSVWSRARKDFVITTVAGKSALLHLQHQDVSYLGDGVPGTTHINYELDDPVTEEIVTFSLDTHCEYVIIGYPYTSDVETLTIPDSRDKKKLLSYLHVDVVSTRGLKAGPNENALDEWFQADPANDPYVLPLENTYVELKIQQSWRKRGGVLIRQDKPLPVKIISISVEATASGLP